MNSKIERLLAVPVAGTNDTLMPAKIRVSRTASVGEDEHQSLAVVLDYGPFTVAMPVRNDRAAELLALLLIEQLPDVAYDLSALPERDAGGRLTCSSC